MWKETPQMQYFRYLMLAQNEDDREDILFQGSKSNILLRKNPFTLGKGSNHINARYFL